MITILKLDQTIPFENKENDVLAIGELLIDMISEDYSENFECGSYKRFFGGSPANIAVNTKKLGINSIVASAVGQDGLGKYLIGKLKEWSLDTSYIQQVNHSTSLVLVTKSKDSPVPIFYRDADYHLEYTQALHDACKNSKILHFSTWPISRAPSRIAIERLIDDARKYNSLICFDPNYHPMLWDGGEIGVEYIQSILKKVDIIKPSKDDAERLFGEDTDENQVEKFLKLGAKLVIMTLGKEGAIVSNGTETIYLKSLAKEVVDTTGAGDAFWSGFYAGIVKDYTIKESLYMGLAVSAYKIMYMGAVADLPPIEKVKDIYCL